MTAPVTSTTQTVALYLRLLSKGDAGTARPAPAWDDGSPLVRMLSQVVTLGGGSPDEAGSTNGLFHARFADVFQAAKTARQIQALVTGFAAAEGEGALAASLVILSASSSMNGEAATAARTYLKQRAQPAQIVFAARGDETSELTRALRTRPLGELFGEGQGFHLHELLWKHKEEAVAAAIQANAHATKQRLVAPPVAQVAAPPQSIRPSLAERGLDLREDTGAMFRLLRERAGAASRRVLSLSRPFFARAVLHSRRFQIGAATVCVVFFTGYLVLHRHSPAISQELPAADTVPSAVPIAPAVPKSEPVAEKHVPVKRPEPPKPELPKKVESEEPERAARGRGSLSPEQTRQVLSRGQAELDRGCYTRAMGYYRRVLDDDPRNGSASGGMEKARTRMRLNGGDAQAGCQ